MKHKKRKNNNNAIHLPPLPPVSQINVSRYSLEAWLSTYPELNEDEWAYVTCPGDIYSFVEQANNRIDIDCPVLRIVTLDDEFLKYLKDNHLENNTASRLKYVNTISDEKALELYNKQDYNLTIDTYGLCHIFVYNTPPTELTFRMDNDDRNELKSYFELIFGKGNVAVSKYMFRPDEFINEFERISSMGETYITEHEDISYSAYEMIGNIKDATLIRRYLPITIQSKRTTPYFKTIANEKMTLLTMEYPDIVDMQKDGLLESGFENVPDIQTLKCFEHIKQKLKSSRLDVESFLTSCEDIPDAEAEFFKILKKQARKTKTKIIKIGPQS